MSSLYYSLITLVDLRNVQNDNIATLIVNDAPRVARVPARTFQAQLSEPAIARRSISAHFESVGSGQWSTGTGMREKLGTECLVPAPLAAHYVPRI